MPVMQSGSFAFLAFFAFFAQEGQIQPTHLFGWNGWVHLFYLEATLSQILVKARSATHLILFLRNLGPHWFYFQRDLTSPRVTQGLCPSEVQCPRDVPVRKSYLFRWPNVQALSSLMAWEDFQACDVCAQIEIYLGSESGTVQLPPGKSNL